MYMWLQSTFRSVIMMLLCGLCKRCQNKRWGQYNMLPPSLLPSTSVLVLLENWSGQQPISLYLCARTRSAVVRTQEAVS